LIRRREGLGWGPKQRTPVLPTKQRMKSSNRGPGMTELADEENESCLVMQDVEGNEFCLD
jgi:hypothetical protein